MKAIFKSLLSFWLEILIGALILFNSDTIKPFLLYFFVVFLLTTFRYMDYQRKIIRFYQISNEIKIMAIIRKLKITDDEISIVQEDEKIRIGKEKWAEIEKEFEELKNNY